MRGGNAGGIGALPVHVHVMGGHHIQHGDLPEAVKDPEELQFLELSSSDLDGEQEAMELEAQGDRDRRGRVGAMADIEMGREAIGACREEELPWPGGMIGAKLEETHS
jgi:hypothetical protein